MAKVGRENHPGPRVSQPKSDTAASKDKSVATTNSATAPAQVQKSSRPAPVETSFTDKAGSANAVGLTTDSTPGLRARVQLLEKQLAETREVLRYLVPDANNLTTELGVKDPVGGWKKAALDLVGPGDPKVVERAFDVQREPLHALVGALRSADAKAQAPSASNPERYVAAAVQALKAASPGSTFELAAVAHGTGKQLTGTDCDVVIFQTTPPPPGQAGEPKTQAFGIDLAVLKDAASADRVKQALAQKTPEARGAALNALSGTLRGHPPAGGLLNRLPLRELQPLVRADASALAEGRQVARVGTRIDISQLTTHKTSRFVATHADKLFAPVFQKYLSLRGDGARTLGPGDLENEIGTAMGLAPDRASAKTGEPFYTKKTLASLAPIAESIRKLSGARTPQVAVIPVILAAGDKTFQLPLFRVDGGGGAKFVDDRGQTFGSFADWVKSNDLPAGKMTYPAHGHLTSRDGRPATVTGDTPRSHTKPGNEAAGAAGTRGRELAWSTPEERAASLDTPRTFRGKPGGVELLSAVSQLAFWGAAATTSAGDTVSAQREHRYDISALRPLVLQNAHVPGVTPAHDQRVDVGIPKGALAMTAGEKQSVIRHVASQVGIDPQKIDPVAVRHFLAKPKHVRDTAEAPEGGAALASYLESEPTPAEAKERAALKNQLLGVENESHTVPATAASRARSVKDVDWGTFTAPRSSVEIEGVTPQIDGGRYAFKSTVGDPVQVGADIFKAGEGPLAARIRFRQVTPTQDSVDTVVPMHLVNAGTKHWEGAFIPPNNGRYTYSIEAWPETFRGISEGLTKKFAAGEQVYGELLEAATELETVASRSGETSKADAQAMSAAAAFIRANARTDPKAAVARAVDAGLVDSVGKYPDPTMVTALDKNLEVVVDRELARSARWYEFFPRSQGKDGKPGTLKSSEELLPEIAQDGFNVVYLPPIHPVGETARKGPNNTLKAGPGDPGSPWAIGSSAGGHTSIDPALGSIADFKHFVGTAKKNGLDVAMDYVLQASPDHPDVKEHPEWFEWRENPDGTKSLVTAENPPKKYQDVANYNWNSPDPAVRKAIWEHHRATLEFWIDKGVKVFRVDNPHTKPNDFWEWVIRDVQTKHPDVVFLAEAFTDPTRMEALSKVGFTQSYTYFPWRTAADGPDGLKAFFEQADAAPGTEGMRGTQWVNTPDILPKCVQNEGLPAHKIRVALAALQSPRWGMYRGFEYGENKPLPGKDEYLDSEKFQLKSRDPNAPNIRGFIRKMNQIAKENPALQHDGDIKFYQSDNPNVIFWGKISPDGKNQILSAISLDPHGPQDANVNFSWADYGLDGQTQFATKDLMTGDVAEMSGITKVSLTPDDPVKIWSIPRPATQKAEAALAGVKDFPSTASAEAQYLFSEGTLHKTADLLGAHETTIDGQKGFAVRVWAPNAKSISFVGDTNDWNEFKNPLKPIGGGLWEVFVPGAKAGEHYKLSVEDANGVRTMKSDPAARRTSLRPDTTSVLDGESTFAWNDAAWVKFRDDPKNAPTERPVSMYEMHLPSWRRNPDGSFMNYRQIADELIPYLKKTGFTDVELFGLLEHPLDDSWGYQVTGYYAPTARHGTPDDFRYLVNKLHENGIGVTLDFVPAHFPKDGSGLANFDGTNLFDHADPRRGEQKDWGTRCFNFDRNEVRSFLIGAADHFLTDFHMDGIRVDAVASMLYRNYSRSEWVPGTVPGHPEYNEGAITFLRQMNEAIAKEHPGCLRVAEESTAFPGVTAPSRDANGNEKPLEAGGLGFTQKWGMGWMHDSLDFLKVPAQWRGDHLDKLTQNFTYEDSEKFIKALSHDEFVYGKGSLVGRSPGADDWQKYADARWFLAFMFAQPGQKLMTMGTEFGQPGEWNFKKQLDWAASKKPFEAGVQKLVDDLNELYKNEPALHEQQYDDAGRKIELFDKTNAVVGLVRQGKDPNQKILFLTNTTPAPHEHYVVPVDGPGTYREVINTDSKFYGGSNVGNSGELKARPATDAERALHPESPWVLEVSLPPLGLVALKFDPKSVSQNPPTKSSAS